MNKTVILTAALILCIGLAHGLEGHNNTGDGDMSITSHSGTTASAASGSGSVRASESGNGSVTLWTAELTMTDRTQDTEKAGTITNVSWHDTTGDKQEVRFTGYVQVPTPCHVIDHEVEETEDGYVFTVKTHEPDEDQMCIQVISTVQYTAAFETTAPYTLTVKHGNTTVETMESPEPADPAGPTDPHRFGVLIGLWNLLTGLL